MNYGASKEDWVHFSETLGLTKYLLPVVSHPTSRISPRSSLKDLGKVPSRYDKRGDVVGFHGWAKHESHPIQIQDWSSRADYGICIRTGYIYAFDIDVDDKQLVEQIIQFIEEFFGFKLPRRTRKNSPRALLAFRCKEGMKKRVIKLNGEKNMIEFLATGQQFVAIGTHPSRARYEWLGGLPAEFPEITEETANTCWVKINEKFGIGESFEARSGGRHIRPNIIKADPFVDRLSPLARGSNGEVHIECPWSNEHTPGSGSVTSTTYFPAGTNGYQQGHFKCFHSHCEHRTDSDFIEALDLYGPEIEPIILKPGEVEEIPLPVFGRDKHGFVEQGRNNLKKALERIDVVNADIRYDRFRGEILYKSLDVNSGWRAFNDDDYSRIATHLESAIRFKHISMEVLRGMISMVARDRSFDSAQEWLDVLKWDGKRRVERFLVDYLGCEDIPYHRAVGLYWWSAHAGRIMDPGCQADMTPVIIGAQGIYKSSALSAMAPSPECYTSISLHESSTTICRKMRGRTHCEIAEMQGFYAREMEAIKAFMTTRFDTNEEKYKEFTSTTPRRSLFAGTSNTIEFLIDETGHRRWLPFEVTGADIKAIKRDMMQLWAEARDRYYLDGVHWQEAEYLARNIYDRHIIQDAWQDTIIEWLHTSNPDGTKPIETYFSLKDVFIFALGVDIRNVSQREEKRVIKILKAQSMDTTQKWINSRNQKVWVKKENSNSDLTAQIQGEAR